MGDNSPYCAGGPDLPKTVSLRILELDQFGIKMFFFYNGERISEKITSTWAKLQESALVGNRNMTNDLTYIQT